MNIPKIKICGITCLEDLTLADSLGADFVGFIQFPESPRYVPPEQLQKILSHFFGKAIPVLVFVNASVEEIVSASKKYSVNVVQLHGEETPDTVNALKNKGLRVIKAFPMDPSCFESAKHYHPDHFLLDTQDPEKKGGTGKSFDWKLLKNQERFVKNAFIAGGITAENIPMLLKQCMPWGLDVSSGVESGPGKKNPQKMRDLFDQIRILHAKTH
jgi:phosphoribosylanthranilate isomerase